MICRRSLTSASSNVIGICITIATPAAGALTMENKSSTSSAILGFTDASVRPDRVEHTETGCRDVEGVPFNLEAPEAKYSLFNHTPSDVDALA